MTSPQQRNHRFGGVERGQVRTPTALYMEAPGVTSYQCRFLAQAAVQHARSNMPKVSGAGARSLKPLYGTGYFGIGWSEDYVWFQETGIHPFTMKRLAGKLIPMWIPDPTGKERRANPKAKTRVTEDGRTQVLIFRKAAKMGARKVTTKTVDGQRFTVDKPASYPGAPGRITRRQAAQPLTTPGRLGGAIARPHVGVRWRHPGLSPRAFLHWGMVQSAQEHGMTPTAIYATAERWR